MKLRISGLVLTRLNVIKEILGESQDAHTILRNAGVSDPLSETRAATQGEGPSPRNPRLPGQEQQGSRPPSTGQSEGKRHRKGIR
jgi:hypothetical protein